MKTIAPVLLFTLVLSAIASAQNPRPRPGRPNSTVTIASGGGSAVRQKAPTRLDHNISIALSGTFAEGTEADLTLTGCGVQIQSETILGMTEVGGNKIPTIATVHFLISENEGAYFLEYSIGSRIPVPTQSVRSAGAQTTTSIGFEEIMITGTVKCELGASVMIYKTGEHSLKLTVTKP